MRERKSIRKDYHAFVQNEPQARSIENAVSLVNRLERSRSRYNFTSTFLVIAALAGHNFSNNLATLPFAHEQFWQISGVTTLPLLAPLVGALATMEVANTRANQAGIVSGYLLAKQEKPTTSEA